MIKGYPTTEAAVEAGVRLLQGADLDLPTVFFAVNPCGDGLYRITTLVEADVLDRARAALEGEAYCCQLTPELQEVADARRDNLGL